MTTLVLVALIFLGTSLPFVDVTAAGQADPDPRSGFVTSWDGAKIHYIEADHSKISTGNADVGNPPPPTKSNLSVSGPHQFPSILFVPGFTMPAWIWENQIAHFSAHYRVVAMDLRSQADSSKTGEGDYPAAHARDIKAVIDQLHLAPVVLVGWSMGVPLVASYVDQFGTSGVAGFVLVDGVAGLDLTPEFIKNSIDFLEGFQTNRLQQTTAFVHSMFLKPQSEEYLQKLIKASMATPASSAIAYSQKTRPA